ncbi:MAG: hypothetical protein LBE48_03165 [Methanomassiliicoccaceae archaeon]|nr:hypothetical protein [Methanomassiliicoccaceae archaeon]
MGERPKSVVIASGLALLGVLFALAAIITGLDLAAERLGTKMAIYILLMVLFLAVAGSLYKNGQWSWRFLIFMEVFCAVLPVAAYIFEFLDSFYTLALAAVACLTIMFTTTRGTKRWIDADRI